MNIHRYLTGQPHRRAENTSEEFGEDSTEQGEEQTEQTPDTVQEEVTMPGQITNLYGE